MVPEPLKPRGTPNIPGYRIEAIIGRGATGIVYRARQTSVDRVVALKVLHEELVGATSAERRLQREARTTARLAHPNIISAIDMGEIDGVWWYAMELVDGVALSERIHERKLSEREALRVFIPLCEALQHAFERGVVHRDIKPANILIDRSGRALLVDLGLAVADDDPLLTKSGGTLGTPHYISPEQARDPASADTQSDIWSLGATLYHAVCGVPPFSGASVAEILSGVLYARIPDPARLAPQLSNGFVLVLRKCLTRDRAKRYATPASLMADLERVRERRQPEIQRSALDPVERDPRERRRMRVALAACGVLVAGLGLWWAIAHASAAPPRAEVLAPAASDPVGELARAVEDSAHDAGALLDELDRLQASQALPPEALVRLDSLRTRLFQRLESEIWSFKREAEARFAQRLAARDFAAADALTKGGLRKELATRLGSDHLPQRFSEDIDLWNGNLYVRLRQERQDAEDEYSAALEREYSENVSPKVDAAVAHARFKDARELLMSDSPAWIRLVDVHGRGLSSGAQERGLAVLRAKLDARRKELDEAWSKLDHELQAFVEARVVELTTELDQRLIADAPALLTAAWNGELARRSLSVEQMPPGQLHLAHERFAKGTEELAARERELEREDARSSFEELDRESAELWKQRRYAELARAFDDHANDAWRPMVESEMSLRVREAQKLQAVLERAAAGVRARDGRAIELRIGTIKLEGTLAAGIDPLQRGFVLTLAGGQRRAFALQAGAAGDAPQPTLVGVDALESFAQLAPAASAEPEERLLRALVRAREGDALGARAALNSGPLPREEPLVHDLELRVANLLKDRQNVAGERRVQAEKRLHLLRRETQSPHEREKTKKRIDEFLDEFSDVLVSDEMIDLRRRRDELMLATKPSTRADFETIFEPKSIELLPPARVRLEYDFKSASAGAFSPGAWHADGVGWSATRYARSDAELLALEGPTLALRDPLRVQEDVLDVRLRIEQSADSPPELLLISVAGFQIALTGVKDGRPARCLIDTADAAEVVAQARAGAGKEFAGFASGARVELRLVLHRSRGTASVELDGKRIAEGQRPLPRGDPANASLAIRSWEPVRLLHAVIEATRR